MSGGTFDYSQYQIDYAVEKIEHELKINRLTINDNWAALSDEEKHDANEYIRPWDALHHPYWVDDEAVEKADKELGLKPGDWDKLSDVSKAKWHEIKRETTKKIMKEHNDSFLGSNFSDETIAKIKEMLPTIKRAKIYLERIDWLFSGDDGEKSFIKRTKEDLAKSGLE